MAYSEVSSRTLIVARVKLPAPTGAITDVLWFNGTSWVSVLTVPADVELDTSFALMIVFRNTTRRPVNAYVDALITTPTAGSFSLTSTPVRVSQNATSSAELSPFMVSEMGDYSADIALMEETV